MRDYVHVTDLASAHVLALEHLLEGRESMAANLGTGQGTSVRQIIESVERVTRWTVRVEVVPPRTCDPPMLIADAARARSSFKWTPQFTSINETVATAVRWHEEHGG